MGNPQLATPNKVTSFWLPTTVRDHLNTTAARCGMSADALVDQILTWGLDETQTYELGTPLKECRAGYRLAPALRKRLVKAAVRHGSVKKQSALFVAIVQAWFARHEPTENHDAVLTGAALHTAQPDWQQMNLATLPEDQNKSGTPLKLQRAKLASDLALDTRQEPIKASDVSKLIKASDVSKLIKVLELSGLIEASDEKLVLREPVDPGPSIQAASIRRLALRQAIETAAAACYGDDPSIQLAYDLFHTINAQWFADTLPLPFIIRGLTPYSHGFSWLETQGDAPLLFLHPRLFAATGFDRQKHQKEVKLWGVPPAWFSPHLLGDVILHECLHAHLTYNKGGTVGPTSHNNKGWITEVNRLLPLLGFRQLQAGLSKPVRVAVTDREATQRPESDGRNPPSRVERRTDGNIPFKAVAMFPIGVRRWLQELHETEDLTASERQIRTANTALAAEHYYKQSDAPFGMEKNGNAVFDTLAATCYD